MYYSGVAFVLVLAVAYIVGCLVFWSVARLVHLQRTRRRAVSSAGMSGIQVSTLSYSDRALVSIIIIMFLVYPQVRAVAVVIMSLPHACRTS